MRLLNIISVMTLLALPALAQDAHFGVSVGLSSPMGDAKDFVDSKMGFTLGANVGIGLKGGHLVRPRLDMTQAKWSDSILSLSGESKITTMALGVDYNYFVSGKASEGFYLLGGLGFANSKVEGAFNAGGFGNGNWSENKTALSLALGLGFQFTPLVGGELRYTNTNPSFNGDGFTNNALNASVTFRF